MDERGGSWIEACRRLSRSGPSVHARLSQGVNVDYRLETTKLGTIMRIGEALLGSDELPVEVEYEERVISQYPIGGMEVTPSGLLSI